MSTFCLCSPSLLKFSQIFKDATLFFSHVMPNLPTVIPGIEYRGRLSGSDGGFSMEGRSP